MRGRVAAGLCVVGAGAAAIALAASADAVTTPTDRLHRVGCDRVVDLGPSTPADRDGNTYVVRTHACEVGGAATAFHFTFDTDPVAHPVVDVTDPEGRLLAVSGEGWRIHLLATADVAVAEELADAVGGTVGRLVSNEICRVRHPT